MSTADTYREFARQARGVSACFEQWALGVAGDSEVLTRIDSLPKPKRQPNLTFAAARWCGATAGPYAALRPVLLDRWDEIHALAMDRSTQTNEAGRCATLLPVLAALPQPLALLEVGASAGLCLNLDRYSYRYNGGRRLDPATGRSPVVLDCESRGKVPVPSRVPEVVWRAGIDLSPIDVHDDDAVAWLDTLIWPEHELRRQRLRAAIALARRDPPHLRQGDLNTELESLAAEAPSAATLVVFHTAVLVYLDPSERRRFVETVTRLPGRWVSNESPEVLPEVSGTASRTTTYDVEPILLALDGEAKAWAGPHGQFLDWLVE